MDQGLTHNGPLGRPAVRRTAEDGVLPRPARLVRLAVGCLCAGIAALGLLLGGFLHFAEQVATLAPPSPLVADGIVVLTGGADRIAGAVELMTAGKARRLLISGVHPATSARQIAKVVDAGPSLMDCCVDLDRRAANTVGNAIEAAKWARANKFLSLIIVTSAYHMPRSMAELSHEMPDIRLIPYPVSRSDLELADWQRNPATLALLFQEYLKYIATRARLLVSEAEGGPEALADIAQ